jgi:hypothetical protein
VRLANKCRGGRGLQIWKPLADPERLELPTSAFEAHCSIQLSYGSALEKQIKRNRFQPPAARRMATLVRRKSPLTGEQL